MPLYARSADELNLEAIQDLASRTNITQLSPGGKARYILEAVNRQLAAAYRVFDLNIAKTFLARAAGEYLDLIGDLFNVRRLPAQSASVDITDGNLRFYVETGTFGDINNGADITASAGTIISTQTVTRNTGAADNFTDTGATISALNHEVIFLLSEDVTLPAASSSVFVAARAMFPGSISSVGARVLRFHNFTTYTDVASNSLKVINNYGIVNGTDQESDDRYRFRIANALVAAEQANFTSVRLAALGVPGVADIQFINGVNGTASFDLYVKALTTEPSVGLLGSVQAAVELVLAFPVRVFVRAPLLVGLEFFLHLNLRSDVEDEEIPAIEANVFDALNDRLSRLDIGESISENLLIETILSADNRIESLGSVPERDIEDLYLYRTEQSTGVRYRERLLNNNYTAQLNERVILEKSIPFPITFV